MPLRDFDQKRIQINSLSYSPDFRRRLPPKPFKITLQLWHIGNDQISCDVQIHAMGTTGLSDHIIMTFMISVTSQKWSF